MAAGVYCDTRALLYIAAKCLLYRRTVPGPRLHNTCTTRAAVLFKPHIL